MLHHPTPFFFSSPQANMSLYERRGGRLGRSLSLLIGDLSSNRPGPNLGFAACGGSTTALPIARSLPGATSCYLQWNNNNDNREREGSAGATDPLSWMNEVCYLHAMQIILYTWSALFRTLANLFHPFLLCKQTNHNNLQECGPRFSRIIDWREDYISFCTVHEHDFPFLTGN